MVGLLQKRQFNNNIFANMQYQISLFVDALFSDKPEYTSAHVYNWGSLQNKTSYRNRKT
ncbi:MAG: hypothetical protein ACOCP8_04070 [archaeon]